MTHVKNDKIMFEMHVKLIDKNNREKVQRTQLSIFKPLGLDCIKLDQI